VNPAPRHPQRPAVDPLILVGVAAAAIAFFLFAVWRWFDDRASAPTPAPNAPAAAPAAPGVPVLSVRRVPALAERDLSVAAFRGDLQPLVDEVSSIGCVAVAVDGLTVNGANVDRPYIPASNQKLLTMAVALEVLGPNHTFTTEVRGPAAAGGVVAGDVYLVGGGDPVLQTAGYPGLAPEPTIHPTNFDALAAQLVSAGVTSITGNVVAVDSRYDDERYPPGWSEGIRIEEAGPLGALVVDDGIAGDAKAVDPAVAAADELVRQLRAAGVTVGGGSTRAAAPGADAAVLASVQSAPLSAIAADTLTNSDDNAAEMVLKELGTTVALPGTRANGASVMQAQLAEWGIDTAGTAVTDGSGLDRANLARCDEILAVLGREADDPAYTDALATLGQTGTLRGVLADHPLAGVLRGKTGSLTGVKSLSGYVPVPGGGRIAYTMLLNADGVGNDYLPVWRRLADALATYPSGPTAAQLAPY
jgi:D-alanyl-D-alanine carboxypeptidase/D-alanyl-D-alanine-endopeptidase (penicillin-binding protein 4)